MSQSKSLFYRECDGFVIDGYIRDGKTLVLSIHDEDVSVAIKFDDSTVKEFVDMFNKAAVLGVLKEIYEESHR